MELNDHKSRAHALLSASSAARWLACPSSAVAAEAYPAQDTEYTREGTLAHEVAEWVASGRSKTASLEKGQDDGITAEMLECARGYSDYIQEQTRSDDAIVLLERRVDFSPWVPAGFGTCDCIILQGDTLVVIDYKYGQGVPVSAVGNPQMKLYALGALNDYGIAYDVKKIEMHIYQPRINNISADSLTVDELMAWAEDEVKPIAQKAIKGKGGYKAGGWCTFCPHAGRCRTLMETCTTYVNTHGLRTAVPVTTPYEMAEALQMEPLITLWLKRVKAQALTTLLEGGEVPGWKVVEGKPGNRKWRDELVVAQTLQAEGYQLNDITETKLLSPAAMDKSIGKKKVAELLSELIDRAPGSPTIVPESDKRVNYNKADDFEKLD